MKKNAYNLLIIRNLILPSLNIYKYLKTVVFLTKKLLTFVYCNFMVGTDL